MNEKPAQLSNTVGCLIIVAIFIAGCGLGVGLVDIIHTLLSLLH